MLPHARRVWATAALGLIALDYVCDRGEPNGDTASECLRALFRTDTAQGRAAFALSVMVGARWLVPHIVNGPLPGSSFSPS